jgi:hypothetical protein
MSQRECAGFNWPPLSIPAGKPVSSSPEAVSRAGCMCIVMLVSVCPRVPRAIAPSPPDEFPSCLSGVGQPDNTATSFSGRAFVPHRSSVEPFQSRAAGVGQADTTPVETLPDVRGADARSAQIRSPEGVARCFQVSAYKVEPHEAVSACNLFAKDACRFALLNEVEEGWP